MDYIFHLKDITDFTKRSSIMSLIKDASKIQDIGLPWWNLPASAGDMGLIPSPGRVHMPQGS